MQLKPLGEQVVVVFGASSGIGRETALRFAAKGAKVVVAARADEGLQSLAEEVRAAGGDAHPVVADALEWDAVRAVADAAVERFGRLDTWVHAAAVAVYSTFSETTPQEFKRVIDTNLVGQAFGAMAALPHVRRAGGGALIHISSVEARRALPYHSAYAASKHGIKGMLDALRLELAKEAANIAVVEVLPASINTPFFDNARTRLGVKPKGIPPVYDPAAVAETILFAAEHGGRELIVGGAGKVMVAGQRLVPKVMDAVLLRAGFATQKTSEPKGEEAPDNLRAPREGEERTRGDLPARPSLYTWFETRPGLRRALLVAAAGAVALTAAGRSRA